MHGIMVRARRGRGQRLGVRGERLEVRGERLEVRGEREAVRGEREAVRGEREAVRGEREAVRGEREAVRGEREAVRGERGEVSPYSLLSTRFPLLRPGIVPWLLLLLTFALPAHVYSAPASARREVREGLRKHAAGEFEAAADSFAKAAEELPEEPRVVYDQACALAAQKKRAEATSLFRRAANSKDAIVAASSHYNLGCLAADEAKELLGEQPAEAPPETREQVGRLIGQAVAHYRDCLRGDPDHTAARRNLEVLRLWLKHMQDVWARRDREKRREEMDLLQFLEWMTDEQRVLEATAKTLDHLDSSPRQRQAIRQTEQVQRMLAEEVDPLQRKMQAAVQDAAANAQGATSNEALAVLNKLASQARSMMFRAADDLAVGSMPAAIDAQAAALEALNDIYSAVAPFESILQKATATQSQLLETSRAVAEDESDAVDVALLARDQQFVSGWAETLPAKAQIGLSQMPQTAEPPEDNEEAQQAYKQQQAMKEAYTKAIELAPRVVELTEAATDHVTNSQWKTAIPEQEEALKLLQEMAPKMPPKDQQDEQQQDDEQKQNEEQQNKDKQDQEQEQEQKKNSQDEQQKQDQQKKADKKKGQQDGQQQQRRQQKLSRQQAEALLRKVRQREREHRDREKKMRALLRGAVPVDRDW